jgi:non-homologous end joining protein Ku
LVVRPYWKGCLTLALVSCPIALHAACSTVERIAFQQVNKATGNRLREQLIDEETREPIAVIVLAPRATISRPSRVTDACPHERPC